MTQDSNIGHELKVARVIAKLSQKEVTAAIGITVPYLSAIENGVVIPSARLLRDLKEAVRWTPAVAALVKENERSLPLPIFARDAP